LSNQIDRDKINVRLSSRDEKQILKVMVYERNGHTRRMRWKKKPDTRVIHTAYFQHQAEGYGELFLIGEDYMIKDSLNGQYYKPKNVHKLYNFV